MERISCNHKTQENYENGAASRWENSAEPNWVISASIDSAVTVGVEDGTELGSCSTGWASNPLEMLRQAEKRMVL